MGVFSTTVATIRRLYQTVYIAGAADPRVECVAIRMGSGGAPSSAVFRVPSLVFRSSRAGMKDQIVEVWLGATYDSGAAGSPDFVGILSTDTATMTPRQNSVLLEAQSLTAWLSKVKVGQEIHQFDVTYRFRSEVTERPTGLTPLMVLADLFTRLLPAEYRARVKLGDTAILAEESIPVPPDLTFRGQNFVGALDQVLALFGDVSWTERFQSGVVYLDFYRVNSPRNGTVSVRVAQQELAALANVGTIRRNASTVDSVTRVIGYGDRRKFGVSVKSYVEALPTQSQPDEKKRLIRDWNPLYEPAVLDNPKAASPGSLGYTVGCRQAVAAAATAFTVETGIEIWENAVLFNPATGERMLVTGFTPADGDLAAAVTVTRGYGGTTADDILEAQELIWEMPGIERVFRQYGLPAAFHAVKKLRDLPWKKSTGEFYKAQAWRYDVSMAESPDPNDADWIGTVNEYPTRLESGATFEFDRNRVIFRDPQVNVVRIEPDTSSKTGVKYTRQEAVVGVTFAYQSDDPIYFDTGVHGDGVFLPFRQAGLTEDWQRDDLQYWQRGNAGYPLTDPTSGTELEFGCVYFDEEGADPARSTTVAAGVPAVVRNDLPLIRAACLEILREKNRPHVSYTITVPYFSRAFRVGKRVNILGVGMVEANLVITQVEWETGAEHRTRITLDNVKPPARMVAGE